MAIQQFHFGGFKGMKASNAILEKVVFPIYISKKIDGIRCHVFPQSGAKSCTLKPLANMYIRAEIEKMAQEFFPDDILDGEVLSGDTFQDCQSNVMSRDGTPSFTYHIFDVLRAGTNVFTFKERYEYLHSKIEEVRKKYPFVSLVEVQLIQDLESLEAIYMSFISAGEEGAMLRAPRALYKFGRSTVKEGYLLKLKPNASSEAVITGFTEGTKNLNNATVDALGRLHRSTHKENKVANGTLGTLKVRDKYNSAWEFEIGTGKGLTHMLRQAIWNNQEHYLGKTITYCYQEIGTKDKPRIPRFCGFRSEDDIRCDY